jgi:hypothetical protein
MRTLLIVSLALTAMTAAANPIGVQVVLLPLNPGTVAGAYSALWSTSAWMHNGSSDDVRIGCEGDLFACPVVQAHSTVALQNPWPGSHPAIFVHVHTAGLFFSVPDNTLWFEMRVTDSVTAPGSAGTEIPLARLADFRSGTTVLPHVPINGHSRLRLRVYGLTDGSASVRAVGATSSNDLIAVSIPLTGSDSAANRPQRFPSYGEAVLAPSSGSDDAMRVEITSAAPIWCFLTVTDNATQQLTTVSPATTEDVVISVAKE